jgi:hypothetical protein
MKSFLLMMVVMVMASGCAVVYRVEQRPEEARMAPPIEATILTGQVQTHLLIAGEVIYRGFVMGRDNVKEDVIIVEITLGNGDKVTLMRPVKAGSKNTPKVRERVYVFTTPLPDKPGLVDMENADIVAISGKRLQ